MESVNAAEIVGYGGFVLLSLREILRFARDLVARRGDVLEALGAQLTEMREDAKEAGVRINSVIVDAAAMLAKMQNSHDRMERFYSQEWPKLGQEVARNTRRLYAVETDVAITRQSVGLGFAVTPTDGVPVAINNG